MVAVATYPIMVDKRLLQISPDKLQEKSHFYGAVIIFKIRKLGGADSNVERCDTTKFFASLSITRMHRND